MQMLQADNAWQSLTCPGQTPQERGRPAPARLQRGRDRGSGQGRCPGRGLPVISLAGYSADVASPARASWKWAGPHQHALHPQGPPRQDPRDTGPIGLITTPISVGSTRAGSARQCRKRIRNGKACTHHNPSKGQSNPSIRRCDRGTIYRYSFDHWG